MKKKLLTPVARCVSVLSLSMLATTVCWARLPDKWKPALLIPIKSSYRAPEGKIRIKIGRINRKAFKTLVLELDDIDVTPIVKRKRGVLILTPPQPLRLGKHELRLVEYATDGSILERGNWHFEVRQTSWFREAKLQANTNLTLSHRIDDDGLTDPPSRDNARGGASMQSAVADGNWRATGAVDFIYNSDETQLTREEHVDLGHFLFTGDSRPAEVKAGHHTPVPDSLIAQGFNRRGFSTTVSSAGGGNTLTAFRMRTENIGGFRDGLGVGQPDKRTEGVTVTVRPFSTQQEALVITATHLFSEGSELGDNESGDEFISGGKARSLVLDSHLLGRRLRLRGEVAQTEYDFDGLDTGFEGEKDDARAWLVVYAPNEKLILDYPLLAQFGVENKRIGTFFKSQANPGAVADRDLFRGFGSLNWAGLDLQVSSGRERDNVNNIPGLGHTQTEQDIVSVSYSPIDTVDPKTGEPRQAWFGLPTYSATFSRTDQNVIEAGSGLSLGPLHENKVNAASASFVYETWDWSVTHTRGEDTDFADLAADTQSRQTDLAINFRVGDKLNLGVNLQQGETTDLDNDLIYENDLQGLNLNYFFSKKWAFNLNYSLNRDRSSGDTSLFIDPVQTNTSDITANLSWVIRQAEGSRVGWQLALDGAYSEFEDEVNPDFSQDSYQIFLKIMTTWAPGY